MRARNKERISLMKEDKKLSRIIKNVFENELQEMDLDLQSILLDDLVTIFHTRLSVLKKIQDRQKKKMTINDYLVPEPEWLSEDLKEIFDHEITLLKNGLRLTKLVPKTSKLKERNHLAHRQEEVKS
jgi:hypothetical protein